MLLLQDCDSYIIIFQTCCSTAVLVEVLFVEGYIERMGARPAIGRQI
jgi:hypothetical protein